MGLDYSFELIAERQDADRLIRSLAEHLTPNNRERLLACLPFTDLMLRNIRRNEFEQSLFEKHGDEHICLSFLFPLDDRLVEYAQSSPIQPHNGQLQVGCVWSSIRCGTHFIAFRAAAATTAMSLLFEKSQSVRATFAKIGQDGGAKLVLFNDEQQSHVAIWPCEGRFSLRNSETQFENYDSYLSALVAAANLAEKSSSTTSI